MTSASLTPDQLLRIEALKAANEFYKPVPGQGVLVDESEWVTARADAYLAFLKALPAPTNKADECDSNKAPLWPDIANPTPMGRKK